MQNVNTQQGNHGAGSSDYEFQLSESLTDPAWDEFVLHAEDGHHVQSSLWAQLKHMHGWKPLRVVAKQDGNIVAGLQVLRKSVPLLGSIGYAPDGPILGATDAAFQQEFAAKLPSLLKSRRVLLAFIQPGIKGGYFEELLVQSGFQLSTQNLAPTATVLVNLEPELDDILGNMKSKTRYNIRYAMRNDVEIFEGTKDDLPLFHKFLSATADRQEFTPYSLKYFERMYDLFNPGGHFKLLFAKHDDEVVSTILLIAYGNTVIYKKGGWSGEKGNLRPNELLHWTAISWSKEQGYKYYDLEGIPLKVAETILSGESIPSDALDTPSRFKIGYGGEIRTSPQAYVYWSNPVIGLGYRLFSSQAAKFDFVKRILGR